jgi:23S rRNA (guanosine2251-2'-O)-methyltransferase
MMKHVTQDVKHEKQREIWVLLHNLRSMHNVGSIFRTADAIGVSRILITGYTPRPLDRFGRAVKEIEKTALGAQLTIPWESYETWNEAIEKARSIDFSILALEQDEGSIDYKEYVPAPKTLIVLGEEVEGIPQDLRAACDATIEIPMRGNKESLNVSVAFGVAVYRLFDN